MLPDEEKVSRNVGARLAQIADDADELSLLWVNNCGTTALLDRIAILRGELDQTKKAVLEHHVDLCAAEAKEGKPIGQVVARLKRLVDRSL